MPPRFRMVPLKPVFGVRHPRTVFAAERVGQGAIVTPGFGRVGRLENRREGQHRHQKEKWQSGGRDFHKAIAVEFIVASI